jgi:hypothetical protein
VNSFEVVAGVRPGGGLDRRGARSDRHFLEFVVDDEPLGRVLGPFLGYADLTEEYVPVLVSDWPTGIALEDVDRLLGAGSTLELAGRTALYVCAECGDLGCGAVTAIVNVEQRHVVWSGFGYQNNYEPFDDSAAFDGVDPFVFDRDQYSAALERFRSLVRRVAPSDGDELG